MTDKDSVSEWDRKVADTLKRVSRTATIYTILGIGVYGGGSIGLILWLHDNPMLLTLVVMFFFQLCLIYFGTQAIFKCIAGGFHVGLLANRETVPVFDKMRVSLEDAREQLERTALDIRESGDRIHEEVRGLREAFTKPITPPPPRRAVEQAAKSAQYNGKEAGD